MSTNINYLSAQNSPHDMIHVWELVAPLPVVLVEPLLVSRGQPLSLGAELGLATRD